MVIISAISVIPRFEYNLFILLYLPFFGQTQGLPLQLNFIIHISTFPNQLYHIIVFFTSISSIIFSFLVEHLLLVWLGEDIITVLLEVVMSSSNFKMNNLKAFIELFRFFERKLKCIKKE